MPRRTRAPSKPSKVTPISSEVACGRAIDTSGCLFLPALCTFAEKKSLRPPDVLLLRLLGHMDGQVQRKNAAFVEDLVSDSLGPG